MSTEVSDFLAVFESLPPAERHEVAVEILRRSAGTEDLTDGAFDELAAELFSAYDAEEAMDAD